MSDDLIARLEVIANDYQSAGCEGPHEATIREAAAALRKAETERSALPAERDALRALLDDSAA